MFLAGLAVFTAASAAAALAPSTDLLVAARAIQGAGAAMVTPLTLTLLAEAFPQEKRGIAIGVWSGISGIAVALGPLVGGAVVQGISWHWIFWINVPIGIVLGPLALRWLRESRGPYGTLDLPGLALASTGAFGVVFGLDPRPVARLDEHDGPQLDRSSAALLLAGFVVRERRTAEPMLPMSFFAKRSFAVTNVASLSMYFGMFGSIFFLSQYMQNVLRQHAPAGRPEAARVDRRHDGRRAARGRLLRAPRQPPVHGRRALAAGRRARPGSRARSPPTPTTRR